MSPLVGAIDRLLAFIPDESLPNFFDLRGERLQRFDELDRAVWVETCRAGLEPKLPARPGADSQGHPRSLGKMNLPGLIIPGAFRPYRLRQWRNDLLALRDLAEAMDAAGRTGDQARAGAGGCEGARANTNRGATRESEGKVGKGKSKGGKQPLEKSNPMKLQVYERIRREHRPGEQHADMVERLKADKDFADQAKATGLKLNTNLVRNALAFFDHRKRNHARKNQETDSA
jgi:hypothetical protein